MPSTRKTTKKTHEKTTPQKTKKSSVTFSEIIEAEKLAARLGVSANKRREE
jgi:hypothetical protein